MSVTQGGRTDFNGTVSVNNFASAAASACLDLTSTTQGALLPRMTTTQQNAISSPATGLTIYNTTTNTLSTYNGSAWNQSGTTLISSQVLGAPAASVVFSSIPQTFNNLRVVCQGRCSDTSGSSSTIGVSFNGDTGASQYHYEYVTFVSTSIASISGSRANLFCFQFANATAGTAAGDSGGGEMVIPNYTGTTFNKTMTSTTAGTNANAGYLALFSGYWNSTAAITSMTFTDTAGGNFSTGTTFYLYGMI